MVANHIVPRPPDIGAFDLEVVLWFAARVQDRAADHLMKLGGITDIPGGGPSPDEASVVHVSQGPTRPFRADVKPPHGACRQPMSSTKSIPRCPPATLVNVSVPYG